MSRFRYQTVLLLLLATLASFGVGSQSAVVPQVHEHPSGCHGRGGQAPANDHACCLTGHDAALVTACHCYHPAPDCAQHDFEMAPAVVAVSYAESVLLICSASPPGADPLRI